MKFPVNVEKVVLLSLFAFYGFIILSYFWTKMREGMTTSDDASKSLGASTSSTPTTSTTPTSSGATENAPKSSGTSQDRIDELNKKIEDLKSKIRDHEKEMSDIKKMSEINTTTDTTTQSK